MPYSPFEVRGARQHALLVEQDRVDHLCRRRARRVPGGGAHQLHELAAALGRALDHRLDPLLRDELANRHAADGGRGDDGDHLIAVAAEHDGRHVLDRRAGLPGDERLQPRRVENAGLAEDALLREPGDVLRDVTHRVEWVRDDDENRVGAPPRRPSRSTSWTIFSFVVTRSSRLIPGERGSPAVITTTSEPAGRAVLVRAGHVRLVAEHRLPSG